jgi:propanediol utilization protein
MKVKVGVSARHVHLTKEDLNILFGENYELTKYKDLSQTGQYAAEEEVSIKTENGIIENVRILGPVRSYTQVEISKTDSYVLKVNPPVKNSGDLEGAEAVTIVGPNGEVERQCCIIAIRHIHITKEEKDKYNIPDIVSLTKEGIKGGVLDNVQVRADESYTFECHIDLDDANAFNITSGEELVINE